MRMHVNGLLVHHQASSALTSEILAGQMRSGSTLVYLAARELLTLAKQCGCEYGKFQKRCPKELLTPEQYAAPHPNPRNSYGDTYGAHREFLELTVDQHRELKEHCDSIGLGYSCSVWDTTSAKGELSLAELCSFLRKSNCGRVD